MNFEPTKIIINNNITLDTKDTTLTDSNKNQIQYGESFKKLNQDLSLEVPKPSQEINNPVIDGTIKNSGYDSDSFQNNNEITINGLPTEILIDILSHLDYYTLDQMSLVCHRWKEIMEDEALWRQAFKETFKTLQFGSVTKSYRWRTEFIMREQYLRNWRKGTSFITSFNRAYSNHYTLNVDFKSERIISFSSEFGDIHISGLRDMKKALTLLSDHSEEQLTAIDSSNYAIITGYADGSIKAALLISPRNSIWSSESLFPSHDSSITSLIVNKRQVHGDEKKTSLYSGSLDGKIYGWNLRTRKRVEELSIGDNKSITHITTDFKGTFVVRDANGSIYYKSPENDSFQMVIENTIIEAYHTRLDMKLFMFTDFGHGYSVIIYNNRVYRYSFGTNTKNQKWRCQTLDIPGIGDSFITSVSYDKENMYSKDENLAGDDGCFSTIILNTGQIIAWNIRQKTEDDKLKSSRSIENPFNVLPGYIPIFSVDNNSLVAIVGAYNGWSAVFDILTGTLLRINHSRIPKKMLPFGTEENMIPVRNIILNDDPSRASGLLSVENVVQYFSYNEDTNLKKKNNKRQGTRGFGGHSKQKLQKDILVDIETMRINAEDEKEKEKENQALDTLITEFNGDGLTEDELFQYALSMSKEQKRHNNEDEDEELRKALELSILEDSSNSNSNEEVQDDDFIKALEMSKLDADAFSNTGSPINSDLFEDHGESSASASASASASSSSQVIKDFSLMSEEELLDFAIKQSLTQT